MSGVDLKTNKDALLQAHAEVSDINNDTNWLLFGYQGQTTTLRVVEKGDGGIEEMMDYLNSGRIMYGYCRVIDPNTNLPKFVLINWQGEGVQELKKGSCASHITDVSNLLRGAHLTVNARSDDDIDEDDILKKVAKASGSNYSFHKEVPRPVDNQTGPVGSVYKRTLPQHEIRTNVRDQFWEKQKVEETKRKDGERQRLMSEKSATEKERLDREEKEANVREVNEADRVRKIRLMKEAEQKANRKEEDPREIEKQQAEALKDAEERGKRSEMLKKERTAEAQNLVQQRGNNPRERFEQKHSQFDNPNRGPAPAPPRKLRHNFMPESDSSTTQRKQQITLPTGETESRPPQPVARLPPSSSAPAPSKPARQPAREPSPEPAMVSSPVSPPASVDSRNLLAENLPRRQKNSDSEPEADDGTPSQPQQAYDDVATDQDIYDDVQVEQDVYDDVQVEQDVYDDVKPQTDQDIYDDVQAQEPQQDVTYEDTTPTDEQGTCAQALYDYQETEDNEITFNPGDIITHIDKIDQGWWIGTAPDGKRGMFPANFVELI